MAIIKNVLTIQGMHEKYWFFADYERILDETQLKVADK